MNITSNFSTAIGIIFQLADGTIQSCNVEASKILGYSVEQLIGGDFFGLPWQTIHPDGSAFLPETYPANASLRTGQAYSDVVMGFYQPGGDFIWLSINTFALFKENIKASSTKPYGVEVSFIDVTQDIKAKIPPKTQAKSSQIKTNRLITDFIPGTIYVFDAIKGENVYINLQAYESLGYTPQQILEMGADFATQVMHPEDLAQLPAHIAKLHRSKQGDTLKFEYRLRHQNGEWRWFCSQDRVYSRTADGSLHQILGIASDITHRQQTETALQESEQRLKLATNASGIGMWYWDLVADTLEWTEQCKTIFGLPADAELSYEKFINILHPEDRDRTRLANDRALANHTEYNTEYRAIWSNGTIHWIVAKGRGFYNQTGEPVRMMGTVQDITHRKQAEIDLRSSEQRLKLATDASGIGMWYWDLVEDELEFTPQCKSLFGLSPEQKVSYEIFLNTLHSEDRDRTNKAIEQALANHTEYNIEYRAVWSNGTIHWIVAKGRGFYNQAGEPVRMMGTVQDISDRKRIESKLRDSEQHLRRVLDSLYTFVGVLTPDGILIEANRTALEAVNLGVEDVIGIPFAETYWWSYSTQSQARLNEAIQRAAAGETIRYDVQIRLEAEHFILIDFSLIPLFDAQGNVEYLIPSGIDISDREASKRALQQREHELKLTTEVIPQQIWTALPNGEVDYFNQRWIDYTGIALEKTVNSGWSAILHPEESARIRLAWAKSVSSGKKFNIEARLRGADGIYRWFLVKARPLRNEQGEIIRWYGTNTSITQIKALEARLREQTEDLIKANQLKDEFLAIVSHELRTPLNPILGWSQLLSGGRLDAEKTSQGIAIIERNAKLQAQLIGDLLDVSRILRGKLNLAKTPLNLEVVIRSALTTVQLAAEAKSIRLETKFEPNIGQVLGDAGRLQQVVWNLVSNAIKFTPEGGKVTVTLERIGTQALIQVTDTGKGIKPEFLLYVFERFSQAESSSTRQFGGLGLGLAIVRHLSEIHGGTVAAESMGEGQGATFIVRLPLMNKAARLIEEDYDLMDQTVQPNRFSGIKILAVDDEADSLDIVTIVLEQEGASVTSVRSAEEALQVFPELNPNLIISDIGMPETDGCTLITRIRQLPQGKHVPAIALTAYAGESDRRRTLDAGFQEHISKPINIAELIITITRLTD